MKMLSECGEAQVATWFFDGAARRVHEKSGDTVLLTSGSPSWYWVIHASRAVTENIYKRPADFGFT